MDLQRACKAFETGGRARPKQRRCGQGVGVDGCTVDQRQGVSRVMTAVATYSYTHSVTYVADNILKSLKDIIRLSGLDPAQFVGEWATTTNALRTWLQSGDLNTVVLEIYDPRTNALVTRWDIDIAYGWTDGD